MEQREAELIDYLQTMWWGKWIILGCVAIALGLGILWASLQPTLFRGTATLRLQEYVSVVLAGEPNAGAAIEATVELALTAVMQEVPQVSATADGSRITLVTADSRTQDAVLSFLSEAERVAQISLPTFLRTELDDLTTAMTFKRAGLEAQLVILRQKLDGELAVNNEPMIEAMTARVAGLETQIAVLQVQLNTLSAIDIAQLMTVRAIGIPSAAELSTSRRMRVIAAGIVGVLMGILLSFLVHYLIVARARRG